MSITRGFLLGKFMPFHEGHLLLCDIAASLVDELSVMVCSRDCEPIDGTLRADWVRNSVKPNVRVLHFHQDIPQEPSEHADFWTIWRNTVKSLHPQPIDTVFGSEDYVLRLACELDAQPFVLDKPRDMMPISATLIRENPQAHWAYIPRVVRPYYQNRVCLLGPESVGKSQLSQYLAKRFNTLAVPEYGRTYDEALKQGENWQAVDFINIAKGHVALQTQLAQRAEALYFEDTDLLQTLAWAEYLLGETPASLQKLLQHKQFADFYLLLKPDVAWYDDGTRYSGDDTVRYWFFDTLQALLTQLDLPFKIIEGKDWQARETLAYNIVKERFKT